MSSQNTADRDLETTWDNLDEGARRAVIALKDFTVQQEKDFQCVISLSPSELGVFLKDFYTHLRNITEDDGNAVSNLHRIRADLSEYFKKITDVDILKGSEFNECNAVLDETAPKEVGVKNTVMKKHSRQRTFTFETNELRQIYLSDAMNLDQPETLQNKVFFDVCMYICNRGKDFLRLMTKTDFEVSNDQTGRRYVWLKFNSKFSFNEVAGGTTSESVKGSQIGERMYERPGDPKCPVLSYTQYAIHLHPMSDAFWQRPKRSVLPTDFVWYDNQCLGNSTLNKLMNRITQSAGLPDSYAINAIKSSYIPIIESICRSALFGSQQFRRILHMKQLPHDMHYVRKRHSEGSLSIASQLRDSPLFQPRHSEPQLPVYCGLGKVDTEHLTRSNSSSPVTRGSSWDSGSPHMYMGKTPERADVAQEAVLQSYRNCDSDVPGYKQNFRDTGQDERAQEMQNHMKCGASNVASVDEERKRPETGSILEAKLKCLDIVHSLEVRDIKSFINWMKTFEVKHESSGLMVTCQPVNEMQPKQQQIARSTEHNGMNGFPENVGREPVQRRNSGLNIVNEQKEFEAKDLDFDCIGDTFCCTSDISPMKITIPSQDTLILTGLQSDAQVLVHRNLNDEKPTIEQKYIPMHLRVFTSNDKFSLQNVKSIHSRKNMADTQNSENNTSQENMRTSFKEEKSIPMKKRIVIDQSEQSHSSPMSGSPQAYPHSRSSPQTYSSRHSSPLTYMSPQQQQQQQQYNHSVGRPSGLVSEHHAILSQSNTFAMSQGPPMSHPPSSTTVSSIPKYRERFPDGWGYFPLQKRQKFGMHPNSPKNEGPLDLIKQS